MNSSDISDPLFSEAVEAIDAGNMLFLEQLLYKHPELVYHGQLFRKKGILKSLSCFGSLQTILSGIKICLQILLALQS